MDMKLLVVSILCFSCYGNKFVKSLSKDSIQIDLQLQAERKLLEMLTEYSSTVDRNQLRLKKYIKKYTEKYNSKSIDYHEYLSHPINNYLLTRRSTLDIDQIVEFLILEPANKIKQSIKELRDKRFVPDKDDITTAANALISIMMTFDLETKALTKGDLKSSLDLNVLKVKAEPLSAVDCSLLSVMFLNIQDLSRGTEMHDIFKRKIDDSDYIGNATELEVAAGAIDQLLSLLSMAKLLAPDKAGELMHVSKKIDDLYKLCRKEEIEDIVLNSDLICRHFRGFNSFFHLAPIRLEEISREPLVVQFHDVLSNYDIEHIKGLATDQIKPALEISLDGLNQTSSFGTRFLALLSSENHEVTKKLNKKIEMITGKKTKRAKSVDDPYVLEIFGAAGQNLPLQKKFTGISINTETQILNMNEGKGSFMFYLSDVPEGGSTIFPAIGVSVRPKKGSALFIVNQKLNGKVDESTTHNDCPTLYGSKLVLHKSIDSNGQMFKKSRCPFH